MRPRTTTKMTNDHHGQLEALETVEISCDGEQSYFLSLSKNGTYWLESSAGEGLEVDSDRLYKIIDAFFRAEF